MIFDRLGEVSGGEDRLRDARTAQPRKRPF